VLKTDGLGPLLDLPCRKSVFCCGAKQSRKSKVVKTNGVGGMEKRYTQLCREVHFEVKSVQHGVGKQIDQIDEVDRQTESDNVGKTENQIDRQ